MQIGVVAKKIGLSVDAIHFYERNGLLPRPPRLVCLTRAKVVGE